MIELALLSLLLLFFIMEVIRFLESLKYGKISITAIKWSILSIGLDLFILVSISISSLMEYIDYLDSQSKYYFSRLILAIIFLRLIILILLAINSTKKEGGN